MIFYSDTFSFHASSFNRFKLNDNFPPHFTNVFFICPLGYLIEFLISPNSLNHCFSYFYKDHGKADFFKKMIQILYMVLLPLIPLLMLFFTAGLLNMEQLYILRHNLFHRLLYVYRMR